jgi:hypothetical protein
MSEFNLAAAHTKRLNTLRDIMTTIAAFNHTLLEFIADLSECFDDVSEIGILKSMIPQVIKQDERGGLKLFMNSVRPYGERLIKKDASIFDSPMVIGTLDVSTLWNAEGLDEGSKTAIMNYLSTLFVIGMTLENVDDNILSGIEKIAENAAEELKSSGSVDVGKLLPGLMQNVGALMGVGDKIPDANDPKMKNLIDGIVKNFTGSSMQELQDIDSMEDMEE